MPDYKGSTIVPVRIEEELLAYLDATIHSVNQARRDEPFNRSTFIRAAILDKLHHYDRSKKQSKRRTKKVQT